MICHVLRYTAFFSKLHEIIASGSEVDPAMAISATGRHVVVIGGGATGLGCALDAASRGYKTLLVEQHDFAKGTSSRSTKLVHGGVRYLQQGNISLVLEALHERGLLMQNAPHLVHHLGDHRIHLARHDRRPRLHSGQVDFIKTGARPGGEQAQIVAYL